MFIYFFNFIFTHYIISVCVCYSVTVYLFLLVDTVVFAIKIKWKQFDNYMAHIILKNINKNVHTILVNFKCLLLLYYERNNKLIFLNDKFLIVVVLCCCEIVTVLRCCCCCSGRRLMLRTISSCRVNKNVINYDDHSMLL